MSAAWRWSGRLPAAQMHLRHFAIVISLVCEVIRMGSGVVQKQTGEYAGKTAWQLLGGSAIFTVVCNLSSVSEAEPVYDSKIESEFI